MNLFIAAIIIVSATWTPLTRCSETLVESGKTTTKCYSLANPHFIHGSTGALIPVDYTAEETQVRDNRTIRTKKTLPLCAGIRTDATTEKFVVIHSDLDWQYEDRRIEWTLDDAKFDTGSGKEKHIPILDKVKNISIKVRQHGEDFAIFNDRKSVRLAQRIPIKSGTDFEITYTLRLFDLLIANKIDDASYAIADPTTGYFFITTPSGEPRYQIGFPKLLDEDWIIVSDKTKHTLKKISEGIYEYKKYPGKDLSQSEINASTWLDSDVSVYTSQDGYIYKGLSYPTNSWATICGSSTGSPTANGEFVDIFAGYSGGNSYCDRAFFYFDTSAISATIESVYLMVCTSDVSKTQTTVGIYVGTQGTTLGSADFPAYTGSMLLDSPFTLSSTFDQFCSVQYWNSTGIAAINKGGTTKLCLREYPHDVGASDPGYSVYNNQCYTVESLGHDPYLAITYVSATSKTPIFFNYMQRMKRQ